MSEQSARLSLPYILPAQAQKHVTHNEAIESLDVLVRLAVEAFDAQTPPSVPMNGQVWARGLAPSGAWAGHGGKLAARIEGAWRFITPRAGWHAVQGTELRIRTDTGWSVPDPADTNNLDGVGIQTQSDVTNRLAVASDASLFTHAGADHQLKINKALATDTASLMFQTAWSGRAEMGTAGSDTFEIKVSADGDTLHTGLSVAPQSGEVTMPNGAVMNAPISGTALTQDPLDTVPGRLTKTGDGGVLRAAPSVTTSADDFPMGTRPRWWVVETTGQGNRAVQRAVEVFGASTFRGRTFVRVKHDTIWHAWREIGAEIINGSNAKWTYPAAFSDVPEVVPGAAGGGLPGSQTTPLLQPHRWVCLFAQAATS